MRPLEGGGVEPPVVGGISTRQRLMALRLPPQLTTLLQLPPASMNHRGLKALMDFMQHEITDFLSAPWQCERLDAFAPLVEKTEPRATADTATGKHNFDSTILRLLCVPVALNLTPTRQFIN